MQVNRIGTKLWLSAVPVGPKTIASHRIEGSAQMNSPLVLPQAAGADGCPAKPAKPRLPDGKAGAVLNTDALLDIFDGDRIAVAAVLRAAIISIKIDAQRVEAAVEARDPLVIRETAHRLKGTSG